MPTRHTAVFPGQYDPITLGHLDIIRRGSLLFDQLIVAVGVNPDKREMFSLPERVSMIRELIADLPNTRVESFAGLTVDFVRKHDATAILRGIRDATDLRFEFQLAQANRAVGDVDTVFIMTGGQFALTSSSLIRQVLQLGGSVDQLASLLPPSVIELLRTRQAAIRAANPPRPDAPAT